MLSKIPPKAAWRDLSIGQLYDVKEQMNSKYWALRSINASFAPQYAQFLAEIDNLILRKEAAERAEREQD